MTDRHPPAELESCENCDCVVPPGDMKHDSEGVPLCSDCFDLLCEVDPDFIVDEEE